MKEDFNEADHAAREEAGGWKEQGRRHAADGNQHLHLRNARKKEKKGARTKKQERKEEIDPGCTAVNLSTHDTNPN